MSMQDRHGGMLCYQKEHQQTPCAADTAQSVDDVSSEEQTLLAA